MDADLNRHQQQVEHAQEPYGISARFYDLLYDAPQTELDGEFYSNLAASLDGPVLELGCGTGRITLKLAQEGKAVTGLDLSETMLARFQEKLGKLPQGIRNLVKVEQGDMTDFSFEERFGLVIIPFRAFLHILDPAMQRRCLKLIAKHLLPDGRFVFNAFNPNLKYIVNAMEHHQVWQHANEVADPQTGNIVRRYYQLNPDPVRQVHELCWKHEVYDRFGKLAETSIEKMELRWMYRWEAEYLLELAGLEIVEAYGGYDRRPLDEGALELIYVCKRKD